MSDLPRERPEDRLDDEGAERPPVQGPGPDIGVDDLLDEGDLPGRPTTHADEDEGAAGHPDGG